MRVSGAWPKTVEVVAHRGVITHADSARMAPENTLPAFQEAARMQASVELDVIATRDGQLVVHHDDETGRVFSLPDGQKKTVRKMSWPELQRARLNPTGHETSVRRFLPKGTDFKTPQAFASVQIPRLDSVLDALPDTPIYLELKTSNREVLSGDNNQLEKRVAQLIREKDLYDRVTVISFSPLALRRLKKLDSRIRTGLDFTLPDWMHRSPALLRGFVQGVARRWLGVSDLLPSYNDVTPNLMHLARQAGLAVKPWVNGQSRAEEQAMFPHLLKLGVDGIITNSVDLLQQAITGPKRG